MEFRLACFAVGNERKKRNRKSGIQKIERHQGPRDYPQTAGKNRNQEMQDVIRHRSHGQHVRLALLTEFAGFDFVHRSSLSMSLNRRQLLQAALALGCIPAAVNQPENSVVPPSLPQLGEAFPCQTAYEFEFLIVASPLPRP